MGLAALVGIPLALFVLGFVFVFHHDAREWVAQTVIGCDGEVTTVRLDDGGGETGLAYYCDVDGDRRRIDLPLLLVAWGPFVLFVVVPIAGYLGWRRRRGGEASPDPG